MFLEPIVVGFYTFSYHLGLIPFKISFGSSPNKVKLQNVGYKQVSRAFIRGFKMYIISISYHLCISQVICALIFLTKLYLAAGLLYKSFKVNLAARDKNELSEAVIYLFLLRDVLSCAHYCSMYYCRCFKTKQRERLFRLLALLKQRSTRKKSNFENLVRNIISCNKLAILTFKIFKPTLITRFSPN